MNNDQDILKLAARLIDQNEGDILKVYECPAGKPTIGRGRNLEDKGISQAESDMMLNNDVVEAHLLLKNALGFYENLNVNRKSVLIDMVHNLGYSGLLRFRKMMGAIQNGDFDEAARQIQQSRYWNQVGSRAKRNYCMMRFDRYFTKPEAESYFKNGGLE